MYNQFSITIDDNNTIDYLIEWYLLSSIPETLYRKYIQSPIVTQLGQEPIDYILELYRHFAQRNPRSLIDVVMLHALIVSTLIRTDKHTVAVQNFFAIVSTDETFRQLLFPKQLYDKYK